MLTIFPERRGKCNIIKPSPSDMDNRQMSDCEDQVQPVPFMAARSLFCNDVQDLDFRPMRGPNFSFGKIAGVAGILEENM